MSGEFAVIGEELKDELLKAGFEIVETKQGKYCAIYYFDDTIQLVAAIEDYLEREGF